MEENERKKLQNDILLMSEIGRQYDLYDREQAKNVLLFIEKRHPFLSPRAEAFSERIRLLASDEAPTECTCLLCGRAYAVHGVFCQVCQGAIDRSVSHSDEADIPEAEEISEVPNISRTADAAKASNAPETVDVAVVSDMAEASETPDISDTPEALDAQEVSGAADTAGTSAVPTEYEIEEEPFSGELGPVDAGTSAEAAKLKKRKNLRQLIPLAIGAVIAIVLLFYAVFTIILPAQDLTSQSSHAKVETQDDAEKIIAKEYDEAEYTTEYQDTISMPEGMFEVGVGEPCGDKWDSDLCEVMVYYVRNIEDPGQYATLMVAPNGRTIGSGTLIMPDDELTMYRIK